MGRKRFNGTYKQYSERWAPKKAEMKRDGENEVKNDLAAVNETVMVTTLDVKHWHGL